jgi:hypothetical protein
MAVCTALQVILGAFNWLGVAVFLVFSAGLILLF